MYCGGKGRQGSLISSGLVGNSILVGSILVGPARECLLKAIWFEQVKVSKTMNAHVEYNA